MPNSAVIQEVTPQSHPPPSLRNAVKKSSYLSHENVIFLAACYIHSIPDSACLSFSVAGRNTLYSCYYLFFDGDIHLNTHVEKTTSWHAR